MNGEIPWFMKLLLSHSYYPEFLFHQSRDHKRIKLSRFNLYIFQKPELYS